MPELSKTARASLGKQVKEIYTETPEKAIAELRNDRAAHLWPNTQRIDALLLAYDNLLLTNGEILLKLGAAVEELRVMKIDNKIYLDRLANRDALINEQDDQITELTGELAAAKKLFEAANAELDKQEARSFGDDGQGVCQGDDFDPTPTAEVGGDMTMIEVDRS